MQKFRLTNPLNKFTQEITTINRVLDTYNYKVYYKVYSKE